MKKIITSTSLLAIAGLFVAVQTVLAGEATGTIGTGGSVGDISVPQNFSASEASDTSINLSWNAVSGVEGYEIYRNNSSLATTTAVSYSDSGLDYTTYTYKIRAFIGSTNSDFTAESSVTLEEPVQDNNSGGSGSGGGSGGGGGGTTTPPAGDSNTTPDDTTNDNTTDDVTEDTADTNDTADEGTVTSDDGEGTLGGEVLGVKIEAEFDPIVYVEEQKELLTTIDTKLTQKVAGRILLQVEDHGEAWYVDPNSLQRYYLADGPTAYEALRKFGLGITNSDLAKIPVGIEERFEDTDTDGDGLDDKLEEGLGTDINKIDTDGDGENDYDEVINNNTNPLGEGSLNYDSALVDRLKGKIVLQVESRGEAWYINPADGKRYYMTDGDAAYEIMRYLSLGITNENIYKVDIGDL